jgi:hypothetical protein
LARLNSCSVDDSGQPSGLIVAESLQAFKLHVAALQLPLVVLLEQQRPDERRDGRFIGEDTDDIGAPLDLGIEPFQRIGAVDLRTMGLWEAHERQDLGFRFIHQPGELGELRAQLIGDGTPLRDRGFLSILGKDGVDHREHHLPLTFAGVRERIADEVHAAALPGGLQNLSGSGF